MTLAQHLARLDPAERRTAAMFGGSFAAAAALAGAEVWEMLRRRHGAGDHPLPRMLTSFLVAGATARGVAHRLRSRPRVGPFRNLRAGGAHVHHYVPGLVLSLGAGAVAIVSDDSAKGRWLAIPYGIGLALAIDESALLLRLEDVYWHREGLVSWHLLSGTLAALTAGTAATRRSRRSRLSR